MRTLPVDNSKSPFLPYTLCLGMILNICILQATYDVEKIVETFPFRKALQAGFPQPPERQTSSTRFPHMFTTIRGLFHIS